MSERTESVLTSEGQNPTPEQVEQASGTAQAVQPAPEEAVTADGPGGTVVVQSTQAAERAAEDEARALAEANRTLTAAGKAYAKGERAYRAGLLEAGKLADDYLHKRMTINPTRTTRGVATQAVEGELAKYASSRVDVNRLVGCFHAFRLLADEPGLAKQAEGLSYGHYRDAFSRLVERTEKDSPSERWILLPGLEEDCRAAFAHVVTAGLSREEAGEAVAALVRRYADTQAAETSARAEAAKADSRKAEAARVARMTEEKDAAEEAERLEKEADAAKGKKREELTRAMEAARADHLAKQKEAEQARFAAEQAAREKAKAEQAAKEAEQARQRAEAKRQAKEERKANRGNPPAQNPAPEARQGANLLAVAKAANPKDVAEMAVELVTGGDAPDDVFAELLRQLDNHKELSRASHRAIKAALVSLNRKDGPSPAEVAVALNPERAGNGQLAVA